MIKDSRNTPKISSRVSEENLVALQKLLTQCKTKRDEYDPQGLARLYHAFHTEMLNVIGNQPFRQIFDQLFHQTWLQILPDLEWTEEADMVCDEISRVIPALQVGDMPTVAQVRRKHMSMLSIVSVKKATR